MVVMWENDDGTTTLSQRFTTAYSMPQPDSNPPRVARVAKPAYAVPGKVGSDVISLVLEEVY